MMVAGTAFGSANAATGIDIMLENDGNKVMVSGATGSSSSITEANIAPNGNFVGTRSNHSPDTETMTYTGSFKVAGPNWAQDGIYTVKITQGTNEATAKIEATNGEIVRLFDFEGSYKDTEKMDHDMEHETKDTMMEETRSKHCRCIPRRCNYDNGYRKYRQIRPNHCQSYSTKR